MAKETDRPQEAEGVAEKRAQADLTSKVGERLTRQEQPSNKKLSTWKSRFGLGRKSE